MTPPPLRPDSELAGIDFGAVFERSPLPMLLADDQGVCVSANPAAAEAFGLAADALPGQRVEELAGRVATSEVRGIAPHRHLIILASASRRPGEPRHNSGGRLSARERQILSRVAQGRDGPQIAKELVVSPATVRTHIGNAIRKLDAHSRAHAIAIALREGLLDDEP